MEIDTAPVKVVLGEFRIIGEGENAELWLSGEMQFHINRGAHLASEEAMQIAEECGYLISPKRGSTFTVTGGDIVGYVRLDWGSPGNMELYKVEQWSCKTYSLK